METGLEEISREYSFLCRKLNALYEECSPRIKDEVKQMLGPAPSAWKIFSWISYNEREKEATRQLYGKYYGPIHAKIARLRERCPHRMEQTWQHGGECTVCHEPWAIYDPATF